MRRFTLVMILCLQALLLCAQGTVGTSTMKFLESVHDFGSIKEQDGRVTCSFEFTNSGSKPFVIENVSVSCGCTTPTYSKAPVMPGKTGRIEVEYDPTGRPGEFLKDIVVTSNNRANRNVLKIKGTVVPRPRTVEDDYPVQLTSGVRISTVNLNFRYIPQGESSSMSVAMINTSGKGVTIATNIEPASPYFKVSGSGTLCAGCKSELTVSYEFGSKALWGVKSDNIYLIINGVRQSIPISSTAIFIDNFSTLSQQQMEDAPKAKFDMLYYNFGEVKHGAKLMREFQLTNVGGLPLIIRAVEFTKGVNVSLADGTIIQPGQSVALKVSIDPKIIGSGRLNKSVVIISNDSTRPMRELRLAGVIQ